MEIGAWLRDLGLERYEQAFREHEIDAELLPTLTPDDLKDLGVEVVGHRRKLLNAIAGLRAEVPETARQADETRPADRLPAALPRDAPGAERRQLTVLFCDLVGSTELAARLDPEDMGTLIRRFQDRGTEVIRRWEGYVAKFMGDGIAVYFGYPKAYEDGAERAVRAGLELAEAVALLRTPAGESLRVRVGIATGLVVVGDLIGEEEAQERSVAGEAPHLAARLQALATPGAVVIGPTTRRLLGDRFELAELGQHRLKGFPAPVMAWQVVGESRLENRFDALHGQDQLVPLIGREEELQLLMSRWQRAKEGDGQVVLLTGEAGIGKSRVAQAVTERVAGEGSERLRFHCSPYHVNSALHPIIEQLERIAGVQRTDPAELKLDKLEAALATDEHPGGEAAALLAPLLSIPTADRYPALDLSPKQRKERTCHVLIARLGELAGQQPLLIVFEDAHWIDPSTNDFLHLLIDQMQRWPVLLVVTFRPEFSPPWTTYSHITQLSLSRLSQRHASRLVEELAAGQALPEPVLAQILIKTDGVPLFVEELTRTVLESGLLDEPGEAVALCGPWSPLAIPSTLHDSLLARLDRLAPVKEVAQTAAVIGREFSRELLSVVVRMPVDALDDALDQLVGSGLILRRGDALDGTLSFKHALVRDAAYQSLLRSRRRQLHARVAQVLESRFAELAAAEPELLAWHYTGANLKEQAIRYWQRAGQHAVERAAHAEAIAHLNHGLELLGTLPASTERAELELRLQIALGPALMAARGQGAPEVGKAYGRARELCAEAGQPLQRFPVLWGLWRFCSIRAEHDAARQLAEEALELAEELHDPALLVAAHSALGGTLLWLGRVVEAERHLDLAAASYDAGEIAALPFRFGQDPAVSSLSYSAWGLWGLGYPDQALERSREAQALADRLGRAVSRAAALVYAAMTHQFRREGPAAQRCAETAIALSEQHGLPQFQTVGTIMRGWALSAQRMADEGVELMRQALATRREQGIELARPWYLALLAGAYHQLDQVDEGLRAVEEALALSDAGFYAPELHRLNGVLLLRQGGLDAADTSARCYQSALDLARAQGTRAWELRAATSLAELLARQGRRRAARELLAPVHASFTEGFETADLVDASRLLEQLA